MKNGVLILKQPEKVVLTSVKTTEVNKIEGKFQIKDALAYIKKGLIKNSYLF